jgi:hypothetical protein
MQIGGTFGNENGMIDSRHYNNNPWALQPFEARTYQQTGGLTSICP